MKYAITGPQGRILRVLDEEKSNTLPITNKQAALVESKADPMGYWIVEGAFVSGADKNNNDRIKRQQEREAQRLANMTLEEKKQYDQRLKLQLIHAAAVTAFESLPLGKKAFWEPIRLAVSKAILSGNITDAREILLTLPVMYEGAEADRDIFLGFFN
jgi:hypothetical protein